MEMLLGSRRPREAPPPGSHPRVVCQAEIPALSPMRRGIARRPETGLRHERFPVAAELAFQVSAQALAANRIHTGVLRPRPRPGARSWRVLVDRSPRRTCGASNPAATRVTGASRPAL